MLWNSCTVLCFESITFFRESRRWDASVISISFSCNNAVKGRVKLRIDLVKTKIAKSSKEAINLQNGDAFA